MDALPYLFSNFWWCGWWKQHLAIESSSTHPWQTKKYRYGNKSVILAKTTATCISYTSDLGKGQNKGERSLYPKGKKKTVTCLSTANANACVYLAMMWRCGRSQWGWASQFWRLYPVHASVNQCESPVSSDTQGLIFSFGYLCCMNVRNEQAKFMEVGI